MVILFGDYVNAEKTYKILYTYTNTEKEIRVFNDTKLVSAYKEVKGNDLLLGADEYCIGDFEAKKLYKLISTGTNAFNLKKNQGQFIQCDKGTLVRKNFIVAGVSFTIDKYNKELYACEIVSGEDVYITLEQVENLDTAYTTTQGKYVKITKPETKVVDIEEPPIRTLEEISLMKDTTWLKNKKYYVVTNDEDAEKLLTFLDSYEGPIAYDTETTGLRINMFSKINGEYANKLKTEYKDKNSVRVDSLVGVIFCVEPNVSYYFPCANRKFRNLFSDGEIRDKLIKQFKAEYTIGKYRNISGDMADYWRNTADEDITTDCIFMERCRNILQNGYIVTHNGTFDWKVAYCYDIDTNISDDTMIMHQLMYKFRNTTSNKGESSALKHLAMTELGIDQLSLSDFFVGFSEKDDKGKVTEKKATIDFSFMTYEGSKAYAPADGDMTFCLYVKYKEDMEKNHKEIKFIYGIELLVSCAIAYMEFYGHRIDEHKIADVCEEKELELLQLESEIRSLAGIRNESEEKYYEELKALIDERKECLTKYNTLFDNVESERHTLKYENKSSDALEAMEAELKVMQSDVDRIKKKTEEITANLKNSMEIELNLGAAGQVADLFYKKLNIPVQGDKPSVAKNSLKPLLGMNNEDGKPKYPIVHKYREWKDTQSLITKFFGSLPEFMYPGGFIFSHYGQIQAATGRMSCSKPNAQQYCKAVTKIVIPRGNNIFFDADYSQIEYRTMVALADEDGLREIFKDPDNDYHTSMASLMFGIPYEQVDKKSRSAAKSFNFGIPYGMGFRSLAILLHGNASNESVEDAKAKYELYFKNQPNVRKFFDRVKESALIKHKTETLWKRERFYEFTDADGRENPKKKASALRQAGNAVIQGCLGGDTLIHTKDFGIVKIKEIAGQSLLVWDGEKWSHGDITYSGKKQKCIVHFTNGQSMICSPIHKFLVRDTNGKEHFVECQKLRGRRKSTTPHKVVINREYASSNSMLSGIDPFKYGKYMGGLFAGDWISANDIRHLLTMVPLDFVSGFFNEFISKRGYDSEIILYLGDLCSVMQKYLTLMGIRSEYKICDCGELLHIYSEDKDKFLNTIRYNERKFIKKCLTLNVDYVEITEEYIDMYDVCNTDGGYYVADGVITHNTAADIFKISVARNWNWIRANKLYGKVLIVNMVHDEQLIEIDCDHVNVLKAFADIVHNMQFKLEGFPPLFVGGGMGYNWNYAKGEDAEIHPQLADKLIELSKKYNNILSKPQDRSKWFNFFDTYVKEFRLQKVIKYITSPENFGKAIHPAVLALLNKDFSYGLKQEKDETDTEYLERLFNQFIEKNNVEADYNNFKTINTEIINEEEADKVYYDDEDELGDDLLDETDLDDADEFNLLTEQENLYGITREDLIKEFGVYVSEAQRVCGVRMDLVTEKNKNDFITYIESVVTEDKDAMDFCLLDKLGKLHTQFKVRASGKDIINSLGIRSILYN